MRIHGYDPVCPAEKVCHDAIGHRLSLVEHLVLSEEAKIRQNKRDLPCFQLFRGPKSEQRLDQDCVRVRVERIDENRVLPFHVFRYLHLYLAVREETHNRLSVFCLYPSG